MTLHWFIYFFKSFFHKSLNKNHLYKSSIFQSYLTYFLGQVQKIKKNSPQKEFLTFQEMEFSSSNIKKILIFSQKKAFLIFWKIELSDSKVKKRLIFLEIKTCASQPKPKKKKKNPPRQNFFTLGNGNLKTETLKKVLIFQEVTYKAWKSKISYTFLYKEVKFSKLKYFLIIKMWYFSSFYNTFFYTQQAFNLLQDFCNVHDHIVTFFVFPIYKDFDIFYDLFLQSFFNFLIIFNW